MEMSVYMCMHVRVCVGCVLVWIGYVLGVCWCVLGVCWQSKGFQREEQSLLK